MNSKKIHKAVELTSLAAMAAAAPRGIRSGFRMDATNPETLLKEVKESISTLTGEVRQIAENAMKEAKTAGQLSQETKNAADVNLKTLNELRAACEKLTAKLEDNDKNITDLYQKIAGSAKGPTSALDWGQTVLDSDAFKAFNAAGASGKSGRISIRNDITSISTSGGAMITNDRQAGIVELPRREILIRDLLTQGNTTSNMIEYVRETLFTNNAAVVSEGVQKPESEMTFEVDTAPIRTIAHWVHVTRQAMDDAPQLRAIINSRLRYGLDLAEEAEILNGDGTGEHMLGIIPQATTYDAQFAVASQTIIDRIRLAMLQVELAMFAPDGIVLHPIQWAQVELTKDGNALYVMSNPAGRLTPRLWGLPVVSTLAMDESEYLVGAFRMGAAYFTRMEIEVLVSSEDRDNFVKNMLTVRAEKRGTVVVYRPAAFVHGDVDSGT